MFELVVKLLIIAAVLLAAVGAGMVPILAKQWRRSERLLSLANALAGGLFLGAGFLHLLPQSHQDFGGVLDYPMAPLLAAVGVCGLLFVERVVFESVKPEGAGTARPIYTYALLVVLSTHSVIAGIAIGLEDTFVAASVMVAIAILFYQGSAAFTLGLQFACLRCPAQASTAVAGDVRTHGADRHCHRSGNGQSSRR